MTSLWRERAGATLHGGRGRSVPGRMPALLYRCLLVLLLLGTVAAAQSGPLVVRQNQFPFFVARGNSVDLPSALTVPTDGGFALDATDPDAPGRSVRWTVITTPSSGLLTRVDNVLLPTVLGVGATFLQSDVDAGYIRYSHDGQSISDQFALRPDDQAGETGATFPVPISIALGIPTIRYNNEINLTLDRRISASQAAVSLFADGEVQASSPRDGDTPIELVIASVGFRISGDTLDVANVTTVPGVPGVFSNNLVLGEANRRIITYNPNPTDPTTDQAIAIYFPQSSSAVAQDLRITLIGLSLGPADSTRSVHALNGLLRMITYDRLGARLRTPAGRQFQANIQIRVDGGTTFSTRGPVQNVSVLSDDTPPTSGDLSTPAWTVIAGTTVVGDIRIFDPDSSASEIQVRAVTAPPDDEPVLYVGADAAPSTGSFAWTGPLRGSDIPGTYLRGFRATIPLPDPSLAANDPGRIYYPRISLSNLGGAQTPAPDAVRFVALETTDSVVADVDPPMSARAGDSVITTLRIPNAGTQTVLWSAVPPQVWIDGFLVIPQIVSATSTVASVTCTLPAGLTAAQTFSCVFVAQRTDAAGSTTAIPLPITLLIQPTLTPVPPPVAN
jgi:hypothetical protein